MKSLILTLLLFFMASPAAEAGNGSSTVLFVSPDDRIAVAMVDDTQFGIIYRAYVTGNYVFVRSSRYSRYYLAIRPIKFYKRGDLLVFVGVTPSGQLIYVSKKSMVEEIESRFCRRGCVMKKSVDEYFVYRR